MKIGSYIFILFSVISNSFFGSILDLENVRINYDKAVADKNLCKRMISELKNHSESDVHLAYLGAYQTIWANHVFNPISKISTFKEGKKNIEKAIKQSDTNVEIRFIRLSIQKNSPRFLGYHENISEDENFIKKYKNTITSTILLKMVNQLLSKED